METEPLHIAISDKLCLVAKPEILKHWVSACASMGHLFERKRHTADRCQFDHLAGKICVISFDDEPHAQTQAPEFTLEWMIQLKKQTDSHILAVCSSTDPRLRKSIFKAGAHDILFAPYVDEEFTWRINRFNKAKGGQLHLAGWNINTETGEAFNPSTQLATRLTAAERQVLQLLWQAAGSVVPRSELAQSVGTHSSDGRSLNTIVLRLRKKLEKDPDNPTMILTVPKRGYRLAGVT